MEVFFYKNIKISISSGISKFLKLIVFGQILAKFGSFGQTWADFAKLAMAESIPSFKRKKIKLCNL
jgi:hypothetical protein